MLTYASIRVNALLLRSLSYITHILSYITHTSLPHTYLKPTHTLLPSTHTSLPHTYLKPIHTLIPSTDHKSSAFITIHPHISVFMLHDTSTRLSHAFASGRRIFLLWGCGLRPMGNLWGHIAAVLYVSGAISQGLLGMMAERNDDL